MNDPQQLLNHAMQQHGNGNLGEAEKAYRALLQQDPANPDALHYLGVIGLQVGRFEEATELIRKAVDARPDYAEALSNLGNGLSALGRFEEAADALQRALDAGPESAQVLANLGSAFYQQKKFREAAEVYERALELQPELAEVRRSYADSLVEIGRGNEALREINRALADGPQSLAMQVSLGVILQAVGRIEDSARCFEEILRNQPDLPAIRGNLANAYRKSARYDDALREYNKVLEDMPNSAEVHFNLGMVYQNLGDKQTALEHYEKSVEIDPDYSRGWHGISLVTKDGFTDDEITKILELQQSEDASNEDRMRLGFALGKHYERLGMVDDASEQFLLGNRLRRESYDYDVGNDLQAMENLAAYFTESFFEKWAGTGDDSDRPIFIIGMPRSGTTLVEQILASHSTVYGAGELNLMISAIVKSFPFADSVDYTEALAEASPEKFKEIASTYLAGLPDVAEQHVTDKMPHNFLNVGLIRVIFPNAKIIHCRRDARDTCFSIFKNFFGAVGHFYAYDLEELGRYYKGYEKLMQHWHSVLPGVIHTVDYEAMVSEQEATTRALLDACGLEWQDACLDFHKLKRPVATLSAEQVRQPIYKGSIAAWQNYEKMLAPLLRVLDD
ncbi:MAG: sulfotransferase [Woeseiaceae bacterium]|nr:sulfotransferase [Woeseiaceae bacterium]